MKKNVVVLAEAAKDIERGIDFYNEIDDGVGYYFRDSIIADLRRLGLYFGEHRIHLGFFRASSGRYRPGFPTPSTTGTRMTSGSCRRAGLRRSPKWIRETLTER